MCYKLQNRRSFLEAAVCKVLARCPFGEPAFWCGVTDFSLGLSLLRAVALGTVNDVKSYPMICP